MVDSVTFKKLVKTRFAPIMTKYGFKGSGFKYRRITKEHYIFALIIQPNKYGGSCCVELVIHMDFLPNRCNEMIPVNKVTPYDCEFRRRLSPSHEDYWWDYGNDEKEATKSIDSLIDTFEKVGLPYFNLFSNFPQPFDNISIADIETNSPLLKQLGAPLDLRMSLLLGRVHLFLENKEQASRFAEWGLNNIGVETGLIPLFKELM